MIFLTIVNVSIISMFSWIMTVDLRRVEHHWKSHRFSRLVLWLIFLCLVYCARHRRFGYGTISRPSLSLFLFKFNFLYSFNSIGVVVGAVGQYQIFNVIREIPYYVIVLQQQSTISTFAAQVILCCLAWHLSAFELIAASTKNFWSAFLLKCPGFVFSDVCCSRYFLGFRLAPIRLRAYRRKHQEIS